MGENMYQLLHIPFINLYKCSLKKLKEDDTKKNKN